jgi:hypothetical protein
MKKFIPLFLKENTLNVLNPKNLIDILDATQDSGKDKKKAGEKIIDILLNKKKNKEKVSPKNTPVQKNTRPVQKREKPVEKEVEKVIDKTQELLNKILE